MVRKRHTQVCDVYMRV